MSFWMDASPVQVIPQHVVTCKKDSVKVRSLLVFAMMTPTIYVIYDKARKKGQICRQH